MRSNRLRHVLSGPAPALPATLDGLAERWARMPPRLRWTVVAVVVLAAAALAGAGAGRSPWGPTVQVLVATRQLAPGARLTVADVETVDRPAAAVPEDALTAVDQVRERPLALGVPVGAVVTGAHLREGGMAASLGPDRVAVALPAGDGPLLEAGQRLDLLSGDAQGAAIRLARDATVLGSDGTTMWVDVGRDEAPQVAAASRWGAVTFALLPDAEGPGAASPP